MTLKIVSLDQDTLATRFLADAKTHLRVDGSYDDNYIKQCIQRAIAKFQQINEVQLNPAEIEWTPRSTDFVNGAATIPVGPVTAFGVLNDAEPPADVTADYTVALKWNSIHGVPIQTLSGAAVDGLTVTLTVGIPGGPPGPPPELDISPGALDVILRQIAHLYEHREILIPGKEYVAPDLRLDGTWWRPRV